MDNEIKPSSGEQIDAAPDVEKKIIIISPEKNKDFVEQYVDITKKYTDAPEVFLRAGGFFIVSTLLGNFFSLPDVKVNRLNVWFILSSVPGRMRRSSVISYANQVIKTSLIQHYIMQGSNMEMAENKYSLSQIEDGTFEGIADAIEGGTEDKLMSFFITSSEFGDTLRKIQSGGRHYSSGVDILLSKLYYGEGYIQQLSKRGGKEPRVVPQGTYVTMYSSIQEPHQYLTVNMSRQGLLRRIIFAYVKPSDMTMNNWKEPFMDNYHLISKELNDFALNNIIPSMKFLYERTDHGKNLIPCRFHEDVKKKINEYARVIDEALLHDASDYNLYRQTRWEYQVKLSALLTIAEEFSGEAGGLCNKDIKEILVEPRHYERANKFLQEIDRHTENMMDEITVGAEQRRFREVLERIYNKIKDAGSAGIGHSELSRAFPKIEQPLRDYIAVLIDEERIISRSISTAGRGKMMYFDATSA